MSDLNLVSKKTRRPLLTRVIALATALVASVGIGFAASSSAYGASTTTSAVSASQAAYGPWHYVGKYFWGWHCTSAGNHGLDSGRWVAYKCVGSWIEDYKLYVRYY